MRTRMVAALVLAGVLLGVVFYPQSLAEPPEPRDPSPPAADTFTVTMHFKGEKLTTAEPSAGNATEEKATAAGRPWGARMYGTVVGEWAFLPRGDFEIQGAFKAEIWGQSTTGAKNAGFRLNFYVGNTMWDMYTDRADVSSPHKFTVSSSVTANVHAGVTVRVGLVWLSDPNYFIGPSSGGDFLYGSMDHDSKISMTLSKAPVTMNVTGYERESGSVNIHARINESLGMDPTELGYELMISAGPANVLPEHISLLPVVGGENGTMVTWRWNSKLSNAKSGLYTMSMTVIYSNDTKITNGTTLEIKFPVEQKADALAQLGQGNNPLIIGVLVIIAVIAAIVSIVAWRRRKRKRARLRAEREIAMAEAA